MRERERERERNRETEKQREREREGEREGGGGERPAWRAETFQRFRCWRQCRPAHRSYLTKCIKLNGFRKSTPPQNRQLSV